MFVVVVVFLVATAIAIVAILIALWMRTPNSHRRPIHSDEPAGDRPDLPTDVEEASARAFLNQARR